MNKCKFLVRLVQILVEVKSNFKMTKQIYIIHENDEWVVPLREELRKINAPYKLPDAIPLNNAPMLQPKARRAPKPIKKPPIIVANIIL